MKLHHASNKGYGTIEILAFLLCVTGIIAFSIGPIQKELKGMESARTDAVEAEITYRKERYLFESSPAKIEEFNQAGDNARWDIIADKVQRGSKNVREPMAFIRFSGKNKLFIGRDSEAVLLSN